MNNERVFVDYQKLIKKFYESNNTMYGSEGFCLKKGNKIQKIYYRPITLLNDMTGYKSSKISFPIRYLYDKNDKTSNKVIGEEMIYIEKKDISKSINGDVSIDVLKKNMLNIISEIREFSEIEMCDLCFCNILYNEQGFSLIDTTRWIVNENMKFHNFNIRSFQNSIVNVLELREVGKRLLMNETFINNLLKRGSNGKELLKALMATVNDEYQIYTILSLYQEISLNDDFGCVETIEDMKSYTKILENS